MRLLRSVHPLTWILLGLVVVLLPFCDKAFHIDDPLYLWTARQLHAAPHDVFGFDVNWSGTTAPMYRAIFNPPGIAYYLALVALGFGWSELAMHLAFLLPTLLTVAGIYCLAKRWCQKPIWAVLFAVTTPIFLLSATTLMCDMPMLMLWVWALVFWEAGLHGKPGWLFLGGFLAGLAVLTKYNGILLLPLLLAAAGLRRRAWGWALAAIAVSLVVLGAYEFRTAQLYGQGLFGLTRELAAAKRDGNASHNAFHYGYQIITCLAFLGGGFAAVGFESLRLWTRRALLLGGGGALLLVLALAATQPTLGATPVQVAGRVRWGLLTQLAFWAAIGLGMICAALRAGWRDRQRVTLLLLIWIVAGLGYSVFVNWMVSGRSLLWTIPAFAILLARQLEGETARRIAVWQRGLALAVSAVLALAVTAADYQLANVNRQAAREIAAQQAAVDPRPLWFQGHWGFQYYMQTLGGRSLDFAQPGVTVGEWLITPYNNVTLVLLPAEYIAEARTVSLPTCSWLTTMQPDAGGAFYSNQLGPLPFYFGPIPSENYYVQRLARPIPAIVQ